MKSVFVSLFLIAATACNAASPSTDRPGNHKGLCKFVTPADLGTGVATWFGPCRDGFADGLGVLRVANAGEVRLFAGAMKRGKPERGYLDTGSPETTGSSARFKGNLGLPPRNRAEIQQGCTVAADAAASAGASFEKARNPASAAFYRKWAQTLRHCLDGSGE